MTRVRFSAVARRSASTVGEKQHAARRTGDWGSPAQKPSYSPSLAAAPRAASRRRTTFAAFSESATWDLPMTNPCGSSAEQSQHRVLLAAAGFLYRGSGWRNKGPVGGGTGSSSIE